MSAHKGSNPVFFNSKTEGNMIPAISENKYFWQDQKLWEEYETLKKQIQESDMDPEEYQEKINSWLRGWAYEKRV